jgi:hypothetical protein
MAELYPFLREVHFWISRAALVVGVLMALAAITIGLIQKRDVTPLFRRTVYAVVALMVIEALIGLLMYAGIGARPHDEVHLIYGLGTVLALPFFIYVETTARKRPAMASYIWGFITLSLILLRAIMTGAAG